MGNAYLVVGHDDWLKLLDSWPKPKSEPKPSARDLYLMPSPLTSIPVVVSRFVGATPLPSDPPPSIIHDFDRWFRRAQSRAEQRIFDERWRQLQVVESCWRE